MTSPASAWECPMISRPLSCSVRLRCASAQPCSRTELFCSAAGAVAQRLPVHRLDIDDLADPEEAALAAVARMLAPAERRPRVRADILVDEAHPRLELPRGDAPPAVEVGGEDA